MHTARDFHPAGGPAAPPPRLPETPEGPAPAAAKDGLSLPGPLLSMLDAWSSHLEARSMARPPPERLLWQASNPAFVHAVSQLIRLAESNAAPGHSAYAAAARLYLDPRPLLESFFCERRGEPPPGREGFLRAVICGEFYPWLSQQGLSHFDPGSMLHCASNGSLQPVVPQLHSWYAVLYRRLLLPPEHPQHLSLQIIKACQATLAQYTAFLLENHCQLPCALFQQGSGPEIAAVSRRLGDLIFTEPKPRLIEYLEEYGRTADRRAASNARHVLSRFYQWAAGERLLKPPCEAAVPDAVVSLEIRRNAPVKLTVEHPAPRSLPPDFDQRLDAAVTALLKIEGLPLTAVTALREADYERKASRLRIAGQSRPLELSPESSAALAAYFRCRAQLPPGRARASGFLFLTASGAALGTEDRAAGDRAVSDLLLARDRAVSGLVRGMRFDFADIRRLRYRDVHIDERSVTVSGSGKPARTVKDRATAAAIRDYAQMARLTGRGGWLSGNHECQFFTSGEGAALAGDMS